MSGGAAPLLPPPSASDRAVGALALLVWRGLGLLILLGLLLHPRGRARALRCPAPPPGRAWVHGASHGEQAISRAIRPLFAEGAWPTALALRGPVEGALPAPLDLPLSFEAWLRRARPSRLVLIEAELWPGWLAACRAHGVPVLLLAPRERRGLPRWRRSGPLGRALLAGVTVLPAAEVGDLKALDPDQPAPAPGAALDGALIGLSLRPGDAARLVGAHQRLPAPRPPLVLCPRHPAGVEEALAALRGAGLRTGRLSAGGAGPEDQALVLDQLGHQAAAARSAAAAVLGGSFSAAIGGHSPQDALRAGVPVVVGPHTAANAAGLGAARAAVPPLVFDAPDDEAGLSAAIAAALERGPGPAPRADPAPLERVAAALPAPRAQPERPARPLLRPLQPLWARGVRAHRAWSGAAAPPPLPVIAVGGLSAGGTGKTPLVGLLAARIPGVWVGARGVGRPGRGPRLRVGRPGQPPPHGLGDELELLRRRGHPALSCPDKAALAPAAAAEGARALILDDALQSWRAGAHLRIATLDLRRPTGGGLLPAGEAREGLDALQRVDLLCLYGGAAVGAPPLIPPPDLPARLPLLPAWSCPVGWLHRGQLRPLEARAGGIDVAVGIAHNGDLLALLLDLGLRPRRVISLPDHGPLPPLPPGCALTEKDAARLPPEADVWALILELRLGDGGEAALEAALAGCGLGAR